MVTEETEPRKKSSKVIRVVLWLSIVAVFAAAGGALVFAWVVRSLPNIAAVEISRLTNTRISAQRFDAGLNGSVTIEGLEIRPDRIARYDDAILRAKDVHASFSLGSLLMLKPRLEDVRISDFVVDAQYDVDEGRWNIGAFKLNIPKGRSGQAPAVELTRGSLRYTRISMGKAETVFVVPVDAKFGFDQETQKGYQFSLRTATLSSGQGQSNLSGYWKPGEVTIAGGVSSADIPYFPSAWAVDVLAGELTYGQDRGFSLNLRLKDVHGTYSRNGDQAPAWPAQGGEGNPVALLQNIFGRYRPEGTVDVEVNAEGSFDALKDVAVSGLVRFKDLAVVDRKFPYRLEHLTGTVDFTRDGYTLRELKGKHGDVEVSIEGWSRGFWPNRTYQFRVTSDAMTLDEDLHAALTEGQRKLWDMFKPAGAVRVDYRLTRTSPTDKRLGLTVELLGVNAAYEKFAYPLDGLHGVLFFDNDSILVTDVTSRKNGCKIVLNGTVTDRLSEAPKLYISIDAANATLDATLAGVLPERHRKVYEAYQPQGLVDVQAKVFTPDDRQRRTSFLADAVLKKASVKFAEPSFVLQDVAGTVTITPEAVNISSFNGRYEQSEVSLAGGLRFGQADAPNRYRWNATAKKLAVNERLVGLLPKGLGEFVSSFRPAGNVDLAVLLDAMSGQERPDYRVVVSCRGASVNHERFAYPLKDIRGQVVIDRSGVALEDVVASPDVPGTEGQSRGEIRIQGRIALNDGALGDGSFGLLASDLPLDETLGGALPGDLARVYKGVSPQGKLDLNFENIGVSTAQGGGRIVDLLGQIGLQDCLMRLSGTEIVLNGTVQTRSRYEFGKGFQEGRMSLAAESLAVKGKAVTGLLADFAYDPQQRAWSADKFMGDCYGGRVLGAAAITEIGDGAVRYEMQAGFHKVDLGRFMAAGKPTGEAETSRAAGTMSARLSMGATIGPGGARMGACKLDIVDMQVGKISPLGKLLSVLSLSEPSDYAFDRMLMDSYIKRNLLLIEKLDLSGRAWAFTGSGWMDLPSDQVKLVMTARGQRSAQKAPSVLESLTEGLTGAVVRMEISGAVNDPKIEARALPVLDEPLRAIGKPR